MKTNATFLNTQNQSELAFIVFCQYSETYRLWVPKVHKVINVEDSEHKYN